jgi:hypothetical protein
MIQCNRHHTRIYGSAVEGILYAYHNRKSSQEHCYGYGYGYGRLVTVLMNLRHMVFKITRDITETFSTEEFDFAAKTEHR